MKLKPKLFSLLIFLFSLHAQAQTAPKCSPEFVGGAQCTKGGRTYIEYADGKVMTREYYYGPDNEARQRARDEFRKPITDAESDRVYAIFEDVRKIAIAQITQGKSESRLSKSQLHLVNRLRAASLEIADWRDPNCISDSDRAIPNAYFNRDNSIIRVCRSVVKGPALTIASVLGHELGHAIDDCSGTLPIYRRTEKSTYAGVITPLEISDYDFLEGQPDRLISAPPRPEEGGYFYEPLRKCIADERGKVEDRQFGKPCQSGGRWANLGCRILRGRGAEVFGYCGDGGVGDDISDYIGFSAAATYAKEKGYGAASYQNIFGVLTPHACEKPKESWLERLKLDPHSPDITRLNVGLQIPGVARALGCQGTTGFAFTCINKFGISGGRPASPNSRSTNR